MTEPLTITDAAPLIRSGKLTPSGLLEQCLARIDIYEPAVKAWVYLDRERARRDAERLTDEAKRGQYRGPLHGIPVGIKDIIDVFDMPTGCGSKLWANSYARRDASCVERLRQAGAIILGKTVTTPFAYLDPPVTRNPWNLDRTPGGSSSGSAAAVACGMVLAALGTQTGGSLTRPASYCGVCSLKPTWGRVSVNGVLPLAPDLDHVGVMANCVRDLATVFQVIAGTNQCAIPGFNTLVDAPVPDCLAAMSDNASGVRFSPARLTGLFEELIRPDVWKRYDDALGSLAFARGAPLSRVVPPAGFARVHEAHRVKMAVEAAWTHSDRFSRRPDDYPPRITELVQFGLTAYGPEYIEAEELKCTLRLEVAAELVALDDPYQNGVYVTPAVTDFAPTPETTGSPAVNSPWSFLGFPTVSVPLNWSEGALPFAVQFIGRPVQEPQLLSAAENFYQIFGVRSARRLPPVPA